MKRDAAIYREAARKIAQKEAQWSCLAIWVSAPPSLINLDDTYAKMISPVNGRRVRINDFEYYGKETRADPRQTRNHRVLALCLAAAMAETGDL